MPTGRFAGVRLAPGAPFGLGSFSRTDHTQWLFIPNGKMFRITQMALAKPSEKGTSATVSLRRDGQPDMVVCKLSATRPNCQLSGLIVLQSDEATFVATGAAVDVSGFFISDGKPSSDDEEQQPVRKRHLSDDEMAVPSAFKKLLKTALNADIDEGTDDDFYEIGHPNHRTLTLTLTLTLTQVPTTRRTMRSSGRRS